MKQYQEGDERVVTRFLLWPTTINGERRWLETARIRQRLTFWVEICEQHWFWHNVAWEDQGVA